MPAAAATAFVPAVARDVRAAAGAIALAITAPCFTMKEVEAAPRVFPKAA